ncbi:hypothetical protein [Bradyrhizobium sp. CCBAU 51765]|nr:hypothetical protein [Bradyrhizobium sp. CCBAU 51765]
MTETNFWLFLTGRPRLMRRLTQSSGVFIASLGLALALALRPANG